MGATDIVVSLVPWTMHTPIAELAVKLNKHFASTSYISDAMDGMDAAFRANGKVCFNECGVDPGLDHMSACAVFDDVKAKVGVLCRECLVAPPMSYLSGLGVTGRKD